MPEAPVPRAGLPGSSGWGGRSPSVSGVSLESNWPLALPPDAIAHVELTLDQLGDTVDLFDVPPFDYGDAG